VDSCRAGDDEELARARRRQPLRRALGFVVVADILLPRGFQQKRDAVGPHRAAVAGRTRLESEPPLLSEAHPPEGGKTFELSELCVHYPTRLEADHSFPRCLVERDPTRFPGYEKELEHLGKSIALEVALERRHRLLFIAYSRRPGGEHPHGAEDLVRRGIVRQERLRWIRVTGALVPETVGPHQLENRNVAGRRILFDGAGDLGRSRRSGLRREEDQVRRAPSSVGLEHRTRARRKHAKAALRRDLPDSERWGTGGLDQYDRAPARAPGLITVLNEVRHISLAEDVDSVASAKVGPFSLIP
jgi:hypothetical protein